MFQSRFNLSRERREYYYSIGILLLVPLLVAANTLILTINTRSNFETEQRYKSDLINDVLVVNVAAQINDSEAVTKVLAAVSAEAEELNSIEVLVPKDGSFEPIATQDQDDASAQETGRLVYPAVTTNKRAISQLMTHETSGVRFWRTVTPIVQNDAVVAVIKTDISLEVADQLVGKTLLTSLIILVATIIAIVLLLLNHFKFVEYAHLFQKLKEVDQLKNDFLSVATHELKSPMTVIKGSIENMLDGLTGNVDDKAKESLKVMYGETDRLNNLVNDLLNVSRIEQGRISYDMQPVALDEVVADVVGRYKDKAAEKSITLEYARPEKPYIVSVDKGRLIEIMTNLVDNAIKYSRQGSVKITHTVEDGKLKTGVRDTGIGMSAEDRDKLFTRFYRIRNDDTKNISGTGLGLWIIKQYIESMKGKISVDSMVGVGTEFTVEFPLGSSARATKTASENDQAPPA